MNLSSDVSIEVLGEDEQTIYEGLPIPEIIRLIPGLDKSNRRRAVRGRGLMVRGVVVEEEVEGWIVVGSSGSGSLARTPH